MSANIYASTRYLSAELIASKAIKIHLGVLCKILIYLRTKTLSADRSFFLSPNVHCPPKVTCFVPPLFHKEVPLSLLRSSPEQLVFSRLRLRFACLRQENYGFNMICPGELVHSHSALHIVSSLCELL